MAARFYSRDQFFQRMPQEIVLAADMYRRLTETGWKEFALVELEVYFVSDDRTKLETLGYFLKDVYEMKVAGTRASGGGIIELGAITAAIPLSEENLLCWVMDMCLKGFEHDCRMDGYSAPPPPEEFEFPDESPGRLAEIFDKGLASYAKRNYSDCAIQFTSAIRIFPENANAWYSRAIAKDDLLLNAKAREDYDEALRLSPEFKEAFINRAVNKDEAGDYAGALEDYNQAILLDALNPAVYFNRGNTKQRLGDQEGACRDWTKARDLGADYAEDSLKAYCRSAE
ncbi:tetratricopeptide repeat protein [Chitinophaga deserti]|uniref:tetratricopeptide repeat protein n=1 Tax=Chitinophaga deserti TaxID=2164099 RepID=UPI0013005E3A|nr:tetratricopeptide repeat protein [Chitinophaga deserti]